ncbi:MAG: hypothetical protein ACXVY5_02445 [Gaiellales bacterium]
MPTTRAVRPALLCGMSAASAALAHGGAAALTDPRWALAALSGSTLAGVALVAGRLLVGYSEDSFTAAPLAVLTAAALVLQGAAHAALLLGGAPAHTGGPGTIALHVALAVVTAGLVRRAEHLIAAAHPGQPGWRRRSSRSLPRPAAARRPHVLQSATALHGRAPPRPA